MAKGKSVSFYMEQELKKYMTPEAKNYFLCAWYRYMFPYIPFDTGIMASLMDFPDDEEALKEFLKIKLTPEQARELGLTIIEQDPRNVIHFKAPYASTQYDGLNFNFRTDQHSLACARWAEVAADLHGEQIVQELKDAIKNNKI